MTPLPSSGAPNAESTKTRRAYGKAKIPARLRGGSRYISCAPGIRNSPRRFNRIARRDAPAVLPFSRLVEVPATSYAATDPLTTVPVNVTLGKFLIAPTEVTQHEFEEVMGYNPSFHQGADLPVESVSWWEAIRYCNLRSIRENQEPCYDLESGACDLRKNGYRLPTEAEWTYACGGESTSPFESPAPWPGRSTVARDSAGGQSPSRSESPRANLGSSDTSRVDLLVRQVETSGTKPVGSYPPNRYGLYDMLGNVWEWCNDYFDPVPMPACSYNPAGPSRGLARVIRGGSYISTTSHWARGYRSCMEPGYQSRFTGFRVCRSAEPLGAFSPAQRDSKWFELYNQPAPGYETSLGDLSSLVSGKATVSEWEERRSAIKAKWLKLLGSMEISPPPPKTQIVEMVADQNFTGKLMYLQVEPDWWEKILVMMPSAALTRPCPVVIVPFYDVDDAVGRDLSGRKFFGGGVRGFARLAAQRGYIAVAIRWFGESYGESYNEAVANLKLKHPHCTGLGKWVWDAQRLLDYLYTLPEVDRQHIAIIGHSLGGKMALFAGAFDDRITAVVSSEPGIGLTFLELGLLLVFR